MAFYLVTGGCGFIGSHLVDALLARGDRVRVLDDLSTGRRENLPQGVELRVGCITEQATVAAALDGVEGCFHLAAIASVQKSNEDWPWTHRVNLGGTVNLLDAASRPRPAIPLVYASSAAVYGDLGRRRAGEGARARPLTPYGCDKLGCELNAFLAGLNRGLPSFGLRFFNVYGPRQDPASPYSGVISIFAGRLRRQQPLVIHGDGKQLRDFVHVSDVVRALLAAMAHSTPAAPVVNVCSGEGTTIGELAELMMAAVGRRVPILSGPARPGDIRYSLGVPDRAAEVLNWRAETEFADGLARLLAVGAAAGRRGRRLG